MSRSDPEGLRAFLDSLSPEEKAIRQAAFGSILMGEPASLPKLVGETALAPEEIVRRLGHLAAEGVLVLDSSGNVVGSCGLSLTPTPHQLQIRGRNLYAWCAEDAVGIPAALREDASVASTCFRCGNAIHVEMRAGHLLQSSPSEVRLWIADADVGRSIVGFTCPLINFFCSIEHLELWRGENRARPGRAATLAEAIELGHEWWADVADWQKSKRPR